MSDKNLMDYIEMAGKQQGLSPEEIEREKAEERAFIAQATAYSNKKIRKANLNNILLVLAVIVIFIVLLIAHSMDINSASGSEAQIPDYTLTVTESSAYINYDEDTGILWFSNLMLEPQLFTVRVTSPDTLSFVRFGVAFDNVLGKKYDDQSPYEHTYRINSTDTTQGVEVEIYWQQGQQEFLLVDCRLNNDPPIPTTTESGGTGGPGQTTEEEGKQTIVIENTVVVRLWWVIPIVVFILAGHLLFILRRRRTAEKRLEDVSSE